MYPADHTLQFKSPGAALLGPASFPYFHLRELRFCLERRSASHERLISEQ